MKLITLVTTLALALGGCAANEHFIVSASPPAARAEVVVARPGYFWVHGHWMREGRHWAWHAGHYQAERPGYVYSEGGWRRNGDSYVWVQGGWRSRG